MDTPFSLADSLLDELDSSPRAASLAPTMGRLQKVRYSHDAMIDLVISNPTISQNEIAATFGYSVGWVSNIFASDAFQARMAQRKDELIDPALRLTIEERFKALVTRSLEVLQEKLSAPASTIPPQLALQAAALGARSLGMGRPDSMPPAPVSHDRLTILADRLIVLQRGVRTQHGQVIEGEVSKTVHDAGSAPILGGPPSGEGQPAEGAVRADRGLAD